MVRIEKILPGSIAEELRLEIGTRVVRINGTPVRDSLDLRFKEVEDELELELVSAETHERAIYEINKGAGEPLGIQPAPDKIRECANRCVFCFIDGNPPDVRSSLDLRDDDFRLSFSYGSYVTLTNLGPRGFQRLIDQKLSPLYVSVHATEPEVRMRLLGVPRGGDIMDRLERLTAGGIQVHTQVVLCPEWNDHHHLDRTIEDLWSLGPGILSLSVVPVGLTRYNLDRPVRLLEPEEAASALRQVERARRRAREKRGYGWVYAADEMHYIAREALPGQSYYDDGALVENGVGAVRHLLDDLDDLLGDPPNLIGRRVGVVTGSRMAAVMESRLSRLAAATGARIQLLDVENPMYGPTVNTAGLLPGKAILETLRARGTAALDTVLLPADAINADDRFIDDYALDEMNTALDPMRLIPAHTFGEALAAL